MGGVKRGGGGGAARAGGLPVPAPTPNPAPASRGRPVRAVFPAAAADAGPRRRGRALAGLETVEEGGLVFKRRRRTPKAAPAGRGVVRREVSASGPRGGVGAGGRPAEDRGDVVGACRQFCKEEAKRAEREFEGDDAYVAAAMRQILRHLEENVVKLQRGDWAGPGLLSLDQRKASLRALGERLAIQEGQWQELQERYQGLGEGDAAERERERLRAEENRGAEAVRTETAASSRGRLREVYTSTVNKVEMQVEAMCGLVEGVEALVRKAEAASGELQKMHHHEMFKHFPHHASPQKLVKMLARSVPA